MSLSASSELLDALLRPRAVALVGASDDAERITGRPLHFLRRHGYGGQVYPVNPAHESVLGETCFPSLSDLPETVDHAYLLMGRERVEAALKDCAGAGVKVATILADGYAEAGEEGRARQTRLVELARDTGIRLLGPNSLGVIVPETGLALSANAALQEERLPAGRLMLLSQSGSMLGALMSRGAVRGAGFSALVSVGNEADLSIGEIGLAAADREDTDAFLLFLETLRHREALAAFARAADRAGKPVLVYKLGRSAAGREAALSHTGALLASDRAADAFLRAHAMVRLEVIENLIEAPPLFVGRKPSTRTRKASVLTTTGGGGAMAVDRLGVAGVEVVGLPDEARARLAREDIQIKPGRLTDVTLAGTNYGVIQAVLAELLDDPATSLVVAAIGSSARFQPQLAVQPVIDAARNKARVIAAFIVPDAPDALRRLAAAGIAAFRTPESCADAVHAFLDWRPLRDTPRVTVPALPGLPRRPSAVDGYRVAEALGLAVAPHIVLDVGAGDLANLTLPFDFPVAVKALAPDLFHKTEAGGVFLNVATETGLHAAIASIHAATGCDTVLVQRMENGLGEALVGYRVDPQAGPVVTLSHGGVLAELYDDVAVRPAPVSDDEAGEMIAEVRALAPLAGYRNLPPGDTHALGKAISAFSRLALAPAELISEAEINPLIVREEGRGVVVVDMLVLRPGEKS